MLGQRIRDTRHKEGKTLNELSKITGLTASYISQLERDIIEPSLASLRKIAKAFSVPIYIFLDDEPKDHIVIKKDKRKKLDLPNSSITYEFLTPMSYEKDSPENLEVIYYELDPLSWSSEDFIIHSADECIFIIDGNIELYLGEDRYELNSEDSIFIKKNTPHRFYNPSKDKKVRGVSSISPSVY